MFIGIDVSKAAMDVAARPGDRTEQFKNSSGGIRQLVAWVVARSPSLVVLESTGGFERTAAEALRRVGVSVAVVNPRQASVITQNRP